MNSAQIMKLRVLSSRCSTMEILNTAITRNLTLLIWPVEFLFFLISGKRIGDLLVRCHVVECQGKAPLSTHNIVLNAIIIVIVTLILSLVLFNLPQMRSTLNLLYL